MKTKEQKRREAIERLERKPRSGHPFLSIEEIWERRRAEAKRLRAAFGLTAAEHMRSSK